jgi:hypothetical protein
LQLKLANFTIGYISFTGVKGKENTVYITIYNYFISLQEIQSSVNMEM